MKFHEANKSRNLPGLQSAVFNTYMLYSRCFTYNWMCLTSEKLKNWSFSHWLQRLAVQHGATLSAVQTRTAFFIPPSRESCLKRVVPLEEQPQGLLLPWLRMFCRLNWAWQKNLSAGEWDKVNNFHRTYTFLHITFILSWNDSDDSMCCTELLSLCTLSMVWCSKEGNRRALRFGDWLCLRPQDPTE